jgi:hypothetical protein
VSIFLIGIIGRHQPLGVGGNFLQGVLIAVTRFQQSIFAIQNISVFKELVEENNPIKAIDSLDL